MLTDGNARLSSIGLGCVRFVESAFIRIQYASRCDTSMCHNVHCWALISMSALGSVVDRATPSLCSDARQEPRSYPTEMLDTACGLHYDEIGKPSK